MGMQNALDRLICMALIGLCLTGAAYLCTMTVKLEVPEQDEPPLVHTSLPQRCAHLFEAGSTDLDSPWKRCMNVEAE